MKGPHKKAPMATHNPSSANSLDDWYQCGSV
ncbi:MAG: hypothetical protein ACJAX5_002181 [Patiriisocius sp.]